MAKRTDSKHSITRQGIVPPPKPDHKNAISWLESLEQQDLVAMVKDMIDESDFVGSYVMSAWCQAEEHQNHIREQRKGGAPEEGCPLCEADLRATAEPGEDKPWGAMGHES